jgi:hypothetical protein
MSFDQIEGPFDVEYLEYVSGAKDSHATYNELFREKANKKPCPDLYKLGRIDTEPALRMAQGLPNQTIANVCICAADQDVCSSKNLYPLWNATCSDPLVGNAAKPCQTSYFNTKV